MSQNQDSQVNRIKNPYIFSQIFRLIKIIRNIFKNLKNKLKNKMWHKIINKRIFIHNRNVI